MATTTEAPASHAELLTQPIPFHLCDDRLDRDFADLDGDDLIDDPENLRSHAEVPAPDGFGLPSHDCVVYRAVAPANLRCAPGETPVIETILVSSTTLSELQFEALSIGRRLQDAGALVLPFGAPRTCGMGRELAISFVRARPEVLGFWHLSEELPLPAPPPVPAEARALRTTERPGAFEVRGAA